MFKRRNVSVKFAVRIILMIIYSTEAANKALIRQDILVYIPDRLQETSCAITVLK